jgi:hypothetical protein
MTEITGIRAADAVPTSLGRGDPAGRFAEFAHDGDAFLAD